MRIIDFVMFYQYFDNLEIKIHNRIIDILNRLSCCHFTVMSKSDLQELEDLYTQYDLVRKIETDLRDFFREYRE